MLKLKELWRQIVAGILAALVFTLAYLGLNLVWWAALLIGLAIYVAALLLIERAPEDSEVYVYANLTQADINAAVKHCQQAAEELRAASKANRIDANTAIALESMAQLVEEIGRNYRQDARDLKHSRNFTNHYLPKIQELVKDYVGLSERTVSEHSQERLMQVGSTIRGYLPHLQTIHEACLENDFEKLELETSVLGDVMRLANPTTRGK
jgi:5-bromo-4-chloroindolyl phosphate hydrolysis protein